MYFACFCVFFYRSEVTQPTSSMCFCVFLFINFYFGHKSDRGKHLMCFVCFCVFSYRSQVTRPMCFVCFCVFLSTFSLILLQTGTTTQCVLCVFVFFHKGLRSHHPCVPCVFVCFFNNVYFDPSSERGTHPTCFMCFCVFHHRSQGKQPMCFVCFCVFY